VVDEWRSEEGQEREGTWRVAARARRAEEHSRILEHVLATNEAPTVVKHYAAGEDDQDGVCKSVHYKSSQRARTFLDASMDSNVYWFLSQQPPRRRNRSASSNVPDQLHTHVQNTEHPFYSMRATASASPKNANGRRRRQVACSLDAGREHTEEAHVSLGLQTTFRRYFRGRRRW